MIQAGLPGVCRLPPNLLAGSVEASPMPVAETCSDLILQILFYRKI
jgi:hypothetical protein